MKLKDRVEIFLAENEMSQAGFARSIGVSPTAFSQVLSGDYNGHSKKIEDKAENFLSTHSKQADAKVWIETQNAQIGRFIIEKAISHRKMALIYGTSGYGKTELCRRVCNSLGNGIFIEADAALAPMGLLRKVCGMMRLQPKRSLSDTLTVICEALETRSKVIFLDEAEYLNAKALELMRRINDFTDTPIILSGTHNLIRCLRKHKQLASRIRWAWEMKKMTAQDTRGYMEALQITDADAVQMIATRSRGNFRDTESLAWDSLELAKNGDVNLRVVKAALEVAFIQ